MCVYKINVHVLIWTGDNVTNETLQLYGVTEVLASSAPVEEKEYEGVAGK